MADKFVRIKTSTNNYVWVKEGSVTLEELDVVKNNLTNEIKVVSDSLKDYAKIEDLNDVAEQSKEYTDNQIKTIRENHFIIIDELPTPSKDYVGNIYLVANPDDTYGEYIIIDDNGEYKWEAIGTTQISDDFRVDDALSDTSINPVQNKVIKEALNKTVTTDTDQTISGGKIFTKRLDFYADAGDINIYVETNENGYEEPVLYFNGPFGTTKIKRNTIINRNGGGDGQTFTFPDESGTIATEEMLEGKLDKVTTIGASRVYGIEGNGKQINYAVQRSGNPGLYHIASYMPDADGYGETEPTNDAWLVQKNPIKPYQVANKQYVDTALEDKLDKVTTATYYTRVYAVNGLGEQALIGTGAEPYRYRLAQYLPSGSVGEGVGKFNDILKVGTPIIGNDATNKDYVDKGLWLPAYDETVTYAKDVMVVKDGKIYKSLIDDNIGNLGNAETEATSWEDLLSGKLDKKTGSAGYWKVYGVNGTQQTLLQTVAGYSSIPVGYSNIPVYQPNTTWGNIDPSNGSVMITGDPKAPAHCANKLYVDEQIASVKKYYRHIITYHTNDGAPLYIDIRNSYSDDYTEDYLKSSDSPISNYNGLSAVKFNGNGALVPATIMRQNENIYFTYLGDDGSWIYNASATFVNDSVIEL